MQAFPEQFFFKFVLHVFFPKNVLPKQYFIVLIISMNKVNKTFRSMYPFYNSATGKMVAAALCGLILSRWEKDFTNPLNNFAVIGEADFLLPIFPKDTAVCGKCSDRFLPMPKEYFTNVVAFDFFKNKNDEKRFIKELYRITKKGGKVLLLAPRKNSFWTYDDSMPFKSALQYTDKELKRLFTEAEFSDFSFGKALLLPPALYKENFAAKEQSFRYVLGWLAGITAVEAKKEALAAVGTESKDAFSYRKKRKTVKSAVTTLERKKD